jgi:hypothetical protein
METDSADKTIQPEHSVLTDEDSTVTPELRHRAQTIIDDLNQPEQTRKAVEYAVKFGWRTADVVRRAEAGEDLSWCKTEEIERQMDEWRELRYGRGFLPLTRDQLRSVAADIVNGDASTAENVLVLIDEIERRAFGDDRISLSSLCIDVRDSVMPYTIEFSDLAQQLTERRRAIITARAEEE